MGPTQHRLLPLPGENLPAPTSTQTNKFHQCVSSAPEHIKEYYAMLCGKGAPQKNRRKRQLMFELEALGPNWLLKCK